MQKLEALASLVIIFVFPHAVLDSVLLKHFVVIVGGGGGIVFSILFNSENNTKLYQSYHKPADLNLSLAPD